VSLQGYFIDCSKAHTGVEVFLDLLLVQTGSDEDQRSLFHEEAEQQGVIEVGGRLASNGLWQFWCHCLRAGFGYG
jgi:hypothetical protein